MEKYTLSILVVALFTVGVSCNESGEISDTDTDTTTDTEEPDVDTGEIGDGDSFVSNVSVVVHNRVKTMLVVTWTQDVAADDVQLAFTFENDEWYESYQKTADTGEHQEVIIGVPGNTDVTFHIVSQTGDQQAWTSAYTGTTGAVPSSMPTPTIQSYDESIASSNRWLYGSVNDTPAAEENYYGAFWIYIIDRKGRIVWYHSNLGDNPVIGFPRISRDGRYIYFGNRVPWDDSQGFEPSVVKMTLDWEYVEEIFVDMWDNVDMTDDGSLLYNTRSSWQSNQDSWLKEYTKDGVERNIWNCSDFMGDDCYSNTVNWNPLDDTVFLSFPYPNTVVEIDRVSGDLVGMYGDKSGSYDFSPASWQLEFNHYAHITPHGTFMVSSHMPNSNISHAFMEFDIDRDNEVLTEKWIYNEGNEFAHAMGEAHYVGNGSDNVLGNYGTMGVIKEITQDKQTAWYVKWDAPWANDNYNKMVGHCTLTNDLYALNQGPE